MKTITQIRLGMICLATLLLFSFATKAFCAVNAYIIFTASDGKTTKVAINPDGTFTTPPLKAGTYSWSFGATQTSTGTSGTGSGRVMSSTGASTTTNVAIAGGGDENPTESVSFNFTKIEMKYQEQASSSREASTGLATGKRMHMPITITKEVDRSTPMLFTADLGTVVVDMDGDAVSGTIRAVSKSGTTVGWDIAVQKKL